MQIEIRLLFLFKKGKYKMFFTCLGNILYQLNAIYAFVVFIHSYPKIFL